MALPSVLVFSLKETNPEKYMSFTGPESLLRFGPDESVFTESAKFVVEEAQNGLVHIRSSYHNQYWVREIESESLLSASAAEPMEDQTKVGCTLFRVNMYSGNWVSFQHVRSQLNVVVQSTEPYYVTVANAAPSEFSFLNYSSLLKLPKQVAFKGDNAKFLSVGVIGSRSYLQFLDFDTPTNQAARFETSVTKKGDIRLNPLTVDRFWRVESKWVLLNNHPSAIGPNDPQLLFQVVKSSPSQTKQGVTLLSRNTNKYCKRLDDEGLTSCLATTATSPHEVYACLEPTSLSTSTVVVNTFRQGHVYSKTTSVDLGQFMSFSNGGNVEVENHTPKVCKHTKKLTFRNGVTHPTEISASFNSQIPFLNEKRQIKIPADVTKISNGAWGRLQDRSADEEVTIKIKVPARTQLEVRLMGKVATFEVPFSYTQSDQFATLDLYDGLFTGEFTYTVEPEIISSKPL